MYLLIDSVEWVYINKGLLQMIINNKINKMVVILAMEKKHF